MIYNFKSKQEINNFLLKYNKKKIDFLIVGSGPAGISLASEINKNLKKKSIVLIERGDLNKPNISSQSVFSKNLNIKSNSRVFKVGGTSNVWGSGSTYFENFEMYNKTKYKQKNLWPINHTKLLSLYKHVQNRYKLKIPQYSKIQDDFNFHKREVIIPKKRVNFKSFLNLDEIDLVTNCKIEYFEEKKIPVVFFKNNRNLSKITGNHLILCAGSLETIKLLNKSIIKKKIPLINKKILGKNFMNHPKIKYGKLVNLKKNISLKKNIVSNLKNYRKFEALSLPRKIQKKKNLLNTCVRFIPVKERGFKDSIYLHLKQKDFFEVLKNLFGLLNLKINEIFKLNFNKEIYKMIFHLEMEPNINNKIYFKKNKIVADYKLNKKDYDTFLELYETIIRNFTEDKFNRSQLKKVNFNKIALDASHHMGGTCYNPDKKISFVDKQLKIIGLKKTYICSSSVFPTSGSLSPTATVVALSIYLSEHFKKMSKIKV